MASYTYRSYDLNDLYLIRQDYINKIIMSENIIRELNNEIALRTCKHFHLLEYVHYKNNDYCDDSVDSKKIIYLESTYKCEKCLKYLGNTRPRPSVITRYEYIKF